jgi:hypothetical protein
MKFDNNISIFMNNWELEQDIRLQNFYVEEDTIPGLDEDYIIVKVYVVFSDERHPNDIVHKIYQGFRKWFFGSEKDISPIYLLTTRQSKEIIKIFYESSNNQEFFELFPEHYKKVREDNIQELDFYISTWNHLFVLTNPSSRYPEDSDLGDWNKIRIRNGWKGIKKDTIKNKEKFGRRFGLFHEFVMDQLKASELGMEFMPEERLAKEKFRGAEEIFQVDKDYGQKVEFVNLIKNFMIEGKIELDFKPDQVKTLANSIIEQKKDVFQGIQKQGLNKFIKNLQKI